MSPTTLRQGVAAALTALACATTTSPASAQQAGLEPDPEAAEAALEAAEQALAPAAAQQPADATLALNELAAGLAQLEPEDRRRARALLARPTDGAADQFGDGYPPAAPVESAQSAHFCVFWVDDPGFADAPDLADADPDGVPDYVESVLEIAEHSRAVQVAPGPLGWAPPRPDAKGCGSDPGARADVYLKQLGPAGLFGYEAPDPGQAPARSQHGYLVIDDDYATVEYGYPDPLDPARVTFAHEFNHLLQQGYDSLQDVWMFESTATWAEEFVYPEVDDYLNYVRAFAAAPGTPITERTAAGGLKIYGSSVWNHWLSGSYGVGAVRRAWEVSTEVRPAGFAPAAYERAIRDLGGRSFSHEFTRFAAATAEWRSGAGRFPDAAAYPEMRRRGTLRPARARRFRLDHTAYRLLRVPARGRRPITVRLRAQRGVRAGLALVARRGGRVNGRVVRKRRYLRRGGTAAATLRSPRRYARITAVIVNADGRVRGFRGGDWAYGRDHSRFRVRLRR